MIKCPNIPRVLYSYDGLPLASKIRFTPVPEDIFVTAKCENLDKTFCGISNLSIKHLGKHKRLCTYHIRDQQRLRQGKKDDKDREMIQSSITPDLG